MVEDLVKVEEVLVEFVGCGDGAGDFAAEQGAELGAEAVDFDAERGRRGVEQGGGGGVVGNAVGGGG